MTESTTAIVMNMAWPGVTTDQYDQVAAKVDWRGDPPVGGRYHIAWSADGGMRIVDVWDSAEAFEAFTEKRLMPGVVALGLEAEPVVAIWQLLDFQFEMEPAASCVVSDDMATEMPLGAYTAIKQKVNWEAVPPVGGLLHIAALDGDVVNDLALWTDESALTRFLQDRIMPALRELDPDAAEQQGPVVALPVHATFDPTSSRVVH